MKAPFRTPPLRAAILSTLAALTPLARGVDLEIKAPPERTSRS